MVEKYKKLLLHIDLFVKNPEEIEQIKSYDEVKNRIILNELYKKYALYLIGTNDKKDLLAMASMLDITPYFQDFIPMMTENPMGYVMYRLHESNPEKYLVCGTNKENEILYARRAYMDSVYLGEKSNRIALMSTYQADSNYEMVKQLKLI